MASLLRQHIAQGRQQQALPRRGRQALACRAGQGRAVVILPGLGNNSADYTQLEGELRGRGYRVATAQVARPDWLRNAAGLLDLNYWRGSLSPLPTVNWYLDRVSAALEAVEGDRVTLLAHSAGGWLARVFFKARGAQAVDRLVCLGSPHNPVPKGVAGTFDQTRGILTWIAENCPGTCEPGVEYTTVAGKWIQGADWDSTAPWSIKFVGLGYKQTCGSATAWGDGIVPVETAHLEGARQLTLPDVYHSPAGAVEEEVLTVGPAAAAAAEQKASDTGRRRVWYGSRSVLDQWIEHLGPAAPRQLPEAEPAGRPSSAARAS